MNFEDELAGFHVIDRERVVDGWKQTVGELNVDDCASDRADPSTRLWWDAGHAEAFSFATNTIPLNL